MTEAQVARVLRGYFKTNCFEKYSGQHWVRVIIALGTVDEWAVDATNNIIEARVQASEHRRDLTSLPCSSTKSEWAWMRHARAKRPCLDAGPPPRMSPKELRDTARWEQKQLDQEVRQAGQAVTAQQQKALDERRKIIQELRPVWDHIRPCPSRMPRCFESVVACSCGPRKSVRSSWLLCGRSR